MKAPRRLFRRYRVLAHAALQVATIPGLCRPIAGQVSQAATASHGRRSEDDLQSAVRLAGTVRSEADETPLAGAIVTVRVASAEGRALSEATTLADGYGPYGRRVGRGAGGKIRAQYSGYVGSQQYVLAQSGVVDRVVSIGRGAFIVVSVVDASNNGPVQGARVHLDPMPEVHWTDSEGRASFRDVAPGVYGIRVEHLAYAARDTSLVVADDDAVELLVPIAPRAIPVAPLEVRVTGRDPYLLSTGFYERRAMTEPSFFGTAEEIASYRDVNTLFEFNRGLSVRFHQHQVVIVNGRLAARLGYRAVGELREIRFERIRGVEAYACADAPPEIVRLIPIEMGLTVCNAIVIWTR